MLRCLWPAILPSCLACSTPAAAEQPALQTCVGGSEFAITVLVANRAAVPTATMGETESKAGWILCKAGFSITWVDCPFSTEPADAGSPCGATLGGTTFLVRITRDHVLHHGPVRDTALGFANVTPDGGRYATVLMDSVEEFAQRQQLSKSQVLVHVVAHEMGHMLMGSNSHSSRGLMRAGWKASELREMAELSLLFSTEEVERMRVRIAATLHR